MPLTSAGRATLASLALALACGPVATASAQSANTPAPSSSSTVAASPAPDGVQGRPRLGLALGGGAARGIAHIGLLRWFEEHRIPIDYLAGTSMGGLVGGAYAAGLTPDQNRRADEGGGLGPDVPGRLSLQVQDVPPEGGCPRVSGQLDFGLKGGFKLPSGLNAGQQVELLLDSIALPYYGVQTFDDLPTPFRCVATDIRAGEAVVLGSGSFALALRATMSIPAAFTPVVARQSPAGGWRRPEQRARRRREGDGRTGRHRRQRELEHRRVAATDHDFRGARTNARFPDDARHAGSAQVSRPGHRAEPAGAHRGGLAARRRPRGQGLRGGRGQFRRAAALSGR